MSSSSRNRVWVMPMGIPHTESELVEDLDWNGDSHVIGIWRYGRPVNASNRQNTDLATGSDSRKGPGVMMISELMICRVWGSVG